MSAAYTYMQILHLHFQQDTNTVVPTLHQAEQWIVICSYLAAADMQPGVLHIILFSTALSCLVAEFVVTG